MENHKKREQLLHARSLEDVQSVLEGEPSNVAERISKEFETHRLGNRKLDIDELDAVSGGGCRDGVMCPYCNSENTRYLGREGNTLFYMCDNCHKEHKRAF